ncbi:DnaT-like ssDNA-binding domain-containing protein [Marinomonas aquimarina]|nr:DnaT-like ssDNA-binding domain-containing protein [Marinomonas aquimarina]
MAAPDFLLPVSFNLACELGLEESVLLTYLQQKAHHLGNRQMKISHRELVEMLPFWTAPYVVRLLSSLQMAQALQFRRSESGLEILLEQPDSQRASAAPRTRNPDAAPQSAKPSDDMMSKLSRLQTEAADKASAPQAQFTQRARTSNAADQAPVPVMPSASSDRRGLSDFDLYLEAKERTRQPDQWLPEDATFEQIHQAGIERAFAESLLAEFLLRIKEQRKNVRTWNSEFFKYVKRQWQYKQSDRQSYEGTATYSANPKSNREQVSNALTNIHDTDW